MAGAAGLGSLDLVVFGSFLSFPLPEASFAKVPGAAASVLAAAPGVPAAWAEAGAAELMTVAPPRPAAFAASVAASGLAA